MRDRRFQKFLLKIDRKQKEQKEPEKKECRQVFLQKNMHDRQSLFRFPILNF